MKVSEINNNDLLNYLRIDEEEDLTIYLAAAKEYVKSYTGMNDTEIDSKESIVPLIFVIVADYYENRSFTVSNDKLNSVIKSTLDMYCRNLI